MENIVRRKPALNMHRCAFTGYRPQKMPFGFNESDPRCIDFKRRVKETIQALYDWAIAISSPAARWVWICSPPKPSSNCARSIRT